MYILIGFIFGMILGKNIWSGFAGAFLAYVLTHRLSGFKTQSRAYHDLINDKKQIYSHFFSENLSPLEFLIKSLFFVLGHISKAKGRVKEEDINFAEHIILSLKLNSELQIKAKQSFTEGKDTQLSVSQLIREFRQFFAHSPEVLDLFFTLQVEAVFNDGILESQERELLYSIAADLGMSQSQCEQYILRRQYRSESSYQSQQSHSNEAYNNPDSLLKQAYETLGVTVESSQAEVKKAYRQLMNQYHPDKLVSKNLPEGLLEMAKQKSQEIIQAYQQISKIKGWK